MNFRSMSIGLCICVTAMLTACFHASADPPKPDGSKFTLVLKGKSVGTDTFRLLPEGCDSDVHFAMTAGQDVQFHQTLKFKKGQFSQVATNAGALGSITISLAGDKSQVKIGDKPAATQKLPAVAYPYGDHSPHLWAYVVSAYDSKKGGEQKFNLLFTEGAGPAGVLVLTASLKAAETSDKQVAGKTIPVTRYTVTLNGPAGPIAMEIGADKDKHILFWNVPAQNYSAVRDGYPSLAR